MATSLDELRRRRMELRERSDQTFASMDETIQESYRVAEVARNSESILKNIEEEFESQTKLTKKDISFLFFATALQCVRQYFLTDFKDRGGHQETEQGVLGKNKYDLHNLQARADAGLEIRHHKYYKPSLEEIILHPVPFDTTKGGSQFGDSNPFFGVGSLGHRVSTLGHDPILGWIFGTANIVTSTLTGWNMQSFHVLSKTGAGGGDFLKAKASTAKVLSYTYDALANQGFEGKKKVGSALIKEGIHLASDVHSKKSLPIPVISTFDPKLASSLADYGLDMSNILTVGKQATLAIAINTLVAMIHGMTFNEDRDGSKKLYEVRTRKVITYSNVIASASNVITVAIGATIGCSSNNQDLIKKSLQKLDIGGLLVTLFRLISDAKFIRKVKEEFVLGNFDKMIMGE